MSIFVDDTPFLIEQKYSVILHKKTGKPIGISLEPDDAEGEHIQTIECYALGRDWMKYHQIAEACTVLGRDNARLLRTTLLYPEIILNFFVAWNIKNSDGSDVAIEKASINKMHHSIVKSIAKKWLQMTGGKTYAQDI